MLNPWGTIIGSPRLIWEHYAGEARAGVDQLNKVIDKDEAAWLGET